MRKTISLVLALVFVLSFGSLAFAQNTNSSTAAPASSGSMAKHHRKHKRHHRRHSMKKMGGNTNT